MLGQGHFLLAPLPCGTTSRYLPIWLFLHKHQHAQWPIDVLDRSYATSPCGHLRLHLQISLLGNYVELSPCVRLRLGVGVNVCLRVSISIAPCSDSAYLEAQTCTYTMCTTGDSPPRVVCVCMRP